MSHRILVVEDNPVNQKVTMGLLNGAGYATELAVDGLEAILACKRSTFDLIVMDCQMPRCDGWEATRAIRRMETATGKHVPIIALTAQALSGDREKCLASGMDDYLTKPVDAPLFLKAVRNRLNILTPVEPIRAVGNGPVAAGPHELDVLDGTVVQRLSEYGQDTVLEIYSLLLVDLSTYRLRLEQAIASGDVEDAAKLAHRLKGGCGTAGVTALAKALDQLERQARGGDSAALAAAWPPMDGLIARTEDVIRHLVDGLRSGKGTP